MNKEIDNILYKSNLFYKKAIDPISTAFTYWAISGVVSSLLSEYASNSLGPIKKQLPELQKLNNEYINNAKSNSDFSKYESTFKEFSEQIIALNENIDNVYNILNNIKNYQENIDNKKNGIENAKKDFEIINSYELSANNFKRVATSINAYINDNKNKLSSILSNIGLDMGLRFLLSTGTKIQNLINSLSLIIDKDDIRLEQAKITIENFIKTKQQNTENSPELKETPKTHQNIKKQKPFNNIDNNKPKKTNDNKSNQLQESTLEEIDNIFK